MRVVVHRKALQKQASDYAIALALVLEMSVLYGGFKLAVRLGLVENRNGKMAQASMIGLIQGEKE